MTEILSFLPTAVIALISTGTFRYLMTKGWF